MKNLVMYALLFGMLVDVSCAICGEVDASVVLADATAIKPTNSTGSWDVLRLMPVKAINIPKMKAGEEDVAFRLIIYNVGKYDVFVEDVASAEFAEQAPEGGRVPLHSSASGYASETYKRLRTIERDEATGRNSISVVARVGREQFERLRRTAKGAASELVLRVKVFKFGDLNVSTVRFDLHVVVNIL